MFYYFNVIQDIIIIIIILSKVWIPLAQPEMKGIGQKCK